MDDAVDEIKKEEYLPDTDSFDEPKGDPIPFEPMFSTAAGVKIDVKQESIDKSRKMLTNDGKTPSSSSKSSKFSSPVVRSTVTKINNSKQFVSPFRREEPSSSTKRSYENREKSEEPPVKTVKNSPIENENKQKIGSSMASKKKRKEMHADVMRISRIFEKGQFRLILQESSSSALFIGKISYRRGNDIKFGDRLEFEAEIEKKDEKGYPKEIYIEKVIKNRKNGARSGIHHHSIANMPFCLIPKFIHELGDNPNIKKAVIQINIIDLKIEIFDGCSSCRHVIEVKNSRDSCPKCKSYRITAQPTAYCRLRVADWSGQLLLNMISKTTEKFLELLGYQGVEQWYKFQEPNERESYVHQPMMLEIEKNKEEWEVTDVAEVNWKDMKVFYAERAANEYQ